MNSMITHTGIKLKGSVVSIVKSSLKEKSVIVQMQANNTIFYNEINLAWFSPLNTDQ